MTPVATALVLFAAISMLANPVGVFASWGVSPFNFVWSLFWLTYVLVTKSLTHRELEVGLAGYTLLVLLYDLSTFAYLSARSWSLGILILDTILVCKMERYVTVQHITVISLWLIVTYAEEATRFGLLEYVTNSRVRESREKVYDCEDKPCARDLGSVIGLFCISFGVFYLDYFITRGFASRVHEEKAKVQASIDAAHRIALSLAEFDLESARADLEACADLPEQLSASFRDIVRNLEAYRPYLPDALFDELHNKKYVGGGDSISSGQPGVNTGKACIVFTDIESSTATWEDCPDGMKRGLKLHNSALRECIKQHNGYEVKTIGDAFMVAFSSVDEGVQFSLDVQTALLKVAWPAALYELPLCARDDGGVWGGLRVRIGLNFGPVVVETNSVTGRLDYFGNTVNVAARIEGASVGGLTALSDTVLLDVSDEVLEQAVPLPIGHVVLKGVSQPTALYLLVPRRLRARSTRADEVLRKRAEGTAPAKRKPSATSAPDSTNLLLASFGRDKTFREQLERVPCATICMVQVFFTSSESREVPRLQQLVNDRLSRVLSSLDRSDGTVISVLGASVVSGWNTWRRCVTHVDNSLHFADLLYRSVLTSAYTPPEDLLPSPAGNEDGTVYLGLSTGGLICGNVGTGLQRFMTALGPCVSLSKYLSDAALRFNTFALYSHVSLPTFQLHQRNLSHIMRPVDRWTAADNSQILVCELRAGELQTSVHSRFVAMKAVVQDVDGLPKERTDDAAADDYPWGWSSEYWRAFEDRDTASIMRRCGTDGYLAKVAEMIEQERHLIQPPLPFV
ncbi:Adenylate cyclase [Diplonema papillatum]|nr:Adenylate cyclase [Diplonema papillatum]